MAPKSDRAPARGASASASRPTISPYPKPESRPSRRNSDNYGGDSSGVDRSPTEGSGPRTQRQQYSACGACRMRRVKCDLKDVAVTSPDPTARPMCSNCKERGINCVDEYVSGTKPGPGKQKQLRRGRRIQGAEAVFGRISEHDTLDQSSLIPELSVDFFSSAFFRRFHVQRPIIEPAEYAARYQAYRRGQQDALGPPGLLISKLLVVWAASFGVDEAGNDAETPSESEGSPTLSAFGEHLSVRRQRWAGRVTAMLQEVLRYVDHYGLLRKPTWDGVRALLLLLPLIVNAPHPEIERLALLEAAHSQVYTLCSLERTAPTSLNKDHLLDALVRARAFWYAYITEGVTSGLRGGRTVLTIEDLEAFQQTLPRITPSQPPALPSTAASFQLAARYSDILVDVSTACRIIHSCLTGPRARHQPDEINESMLVRAWELLESSWNKLPPLQSYGSDGTFSEEEVSRFVCGWQMFIFEAHNVIREALKQRLRPLETASSSPGLHHPPRARIAWEQVNRFHQESLRRCKVALRTVVSIVKMHLEHAAGESPLFAFDACLVRDACFYAALLLATSDAGPHPTSENSLREEINLCLRAMRSMRFAFARSDDRERLIEQEWDRRMSHIQSARVQGHSATSGPAAYFADHPPGPLPLSIPTFRDVHTAPDRMWDLADPITGRSAPPAPATYEPITPSAVAFPASIYQAPRSTDPSQYTPPGSNTSRPSTAGIESSSAHPPHLAYAPTTTTTGAPSPLDAPFHYTPGPSSLTHSYSLPPHGISGASSSDGFNGVPGAHSSGYDWSLGLSGH